MFTVLEMESGDGMRKAGVWFGLLAVTAFGHRRPKVRNWCPTKPTAPPRGMQSTKVFANERPDSRYARLF